MIEHLLNLVVVDPINVVFWKLVTPICLPEETPQSMVSFKPDPEEKKKRGLLSVSKVSATPWNPGRRINVQLGD
jgi:hypothetical protein